jgi:hypothetical protein
MAGGVRHESTADQVGVKALLNRAALFVFEQQSGRRLRASYYRAAFPDA